MASGRTELTGLWRDSDFLKLWAGQTVSLLGSQVTRLALPLTAVLVLKATPAQMGLLQAAEGFPHLVLGLAAGVWVDRLARRPILIVADFGRAALLGSIPLAAALGVLHIGQLYVVAILTAILTLFFDVAVTSLVPVFVTHADLLDANSKLTASTSVAQVAGPGLAGVLVQAVTAPVAIALDAVSFVVSAICVRLMRVSESRTRPTAGRDRLEGCQRNAWRELREGLHIVLGDPVWRASTGAFSAFNLFTNVFWAVYLLYLTRELSVNPATIGAAFAAGGVGGLVGALLASRATRQFGPGLVMIAAALINGIGWWPVLVAGGPPILIGAILAAAHFLRASSQAVYGITMVSLRQAMIPPHLQGRVAATIRVIAWGTIPIGSLIGGMLGNWIGLYATLVIGALGGMTGFLWIFLSPVRMMREVPTPTAATLPSEGKLR